MSSVKMTSVSISKIVLSKAIRRISRAFRSLALAAAVLMAAQIFSVPSVQAAPPDYCHFYAQTAMRQLAIALSNPRCAAWLSGSRWSSDYRGHYDWCLWVPFRAAEDESFRRAAQLRACHWR